MNFQRPVHDCRSKIPLGPTPFGRVFTVVWAMALWSPVNAQTPLPPAVERGENEITVETIDRDLAALESNTTLSNAQKANVADLLQRARQTLQRANDRRDASHRFQQMVATAPTDLQKAKEQLEAARHEQPDVDAEATIEALSQRLVTTTSKLNEAAARVTELAAEPTRRRTRLAEIPTLLADTERELDQLRKQQSQDAPANESPSEAQARDTLWKAKFDELQLKMESLQQEQSAYAATTELLPLQKTVAETTVNILRREVELLQQSIEAKQKQRVQDTTTTLRQTASVVPAQLRDLADKNIELAQIQQQLLSKSSKTTQTLADVQTALTEVQSELKSSERRVDAVGLTNALGTIFRQRRADFEALRSKFRPRADLQKQIGQYQMDAFQLEDERDRIDKQLADQQPVAIDWKSTNIPWDRLSAANMEWVLLRKRRQLIDDTLQAQNAVLQTMLTSDTQRRELMQAIDRYNSFVDRHLFWTRSSEAFSLNELSALPAATSWLFGWDQWIGVASQMVTTTTAKPIQSILLVALAIAMIFARPRFRGVIAREGEAATRIHATYHSTIISLLATLASAAVWPVCFATFSFLLLATSVGDPFIRGIGYGFGVLASFIASRELLTEVCHGGGLAETHFGWSDQLREQLRKHLRWYTLFGGIFIFLMVAFHGHPDAEVRTVVSRFASIVLFLLTAAFHHIFFRDRSPLYVQLVRENANSAIYRYRRCLWGLTVLLPIVCAAMAMAGYLQTTFRLGRSMQATLLLFVVVVVLLGLTSRWLTLHRRDAARKSAQQARERRQMALSRSDTMATFHEAGIVLEQDEQADLPKLDHQTRQSAAVLAMLFGLVGLAYIWSDIIPAINYLDEIRLWSVGHGEVVDSVSLLDVLYSALGIATVVFVARNLRGTLELLILSRTSLDSGARYALTSLLRYAVILVGVLVILNLLSVPYNQLGWVLAAASVGLGFGLQEIVANFVCGIILLLERPVRVGDVVTIDGTTGIVSRIQMRATTVTNWDRKELVVPNKDLITQKVLNWSLSNVINRVTINVGVAYGTDPDVVRQVLADVVTKDPETLHDPPPLINLETFGDSSLNFVVRFYLAKLDNRIEVTHRVNTMITKALQEAGITIPFPQRDLHVTLQAGHDSLPVTLHRHRVKATRPATKAEK